MARIDEALEEYQGQNIALYGLGTETERFLAERGEGLDIAGLLDGFRTDGELYGYPIIPLETAATQGVRLILVIARPGSCKAIKKRIGDFCRKNDIALFDVRGKNLLEETAVNYEFKGIDGYTKADLIKKAADAEIISFDLFDTLITRKIFSYTDLFELLDSRLSGKGISIPRFADLRLSAEKECSKDHSPTLDEIYESVLLRSGCKDVAAAELSEMEWELDSSLMIPRGSVCEFFRSLVKQGKRVVITTDNYYRRDRIESLLSSFELNGYEELLVSCEEGATKTQRLYESLCKLNGGHPEKILHIGDDEFADIECAKKYKLDTFRIYSGSELFELLGGLGIEKHIRSLSDRVRAGLFISRIFNDPFVFEDDDLRLSVADASDIGFLFCAPMITDFTLWMMEKIRQDRVPQVLLCARDGYLIRRLYGIMNEKPDAFYFLASRTAAIRAGMRNEQDLQYVDSMKYFGSEEECLKARFGIDFDGKPDQKSRRDAILRRSEKLRDNYKKYMDKLGVQDLPTAMFDFVAKGTSQMYLSRLFSEHMKGYYFLQLEPGFMADKGLDIEPFYSEEEKEQSAIFDNYYILETILTSPDPQVVEFDDEGEPKYLDETRSEQDIGCFMRSQEGISEYFRDYITILKESEREQNKKLDELMLSLINNVKINDKEFMSLTVEDPFFGRMTDIKNVIG